MSIERILLPINDCDDISAAADLAFVLARRFEAQIEGVFPYRSGLDEVWFPEAPASAIQIQELYEQAKKRTVKAMADAEARFNSHGERYMDVSNKLTAIEGRAEDVVAQRGFSADLTVLGGSSENDSGFWQDVSYGAIVNSGRPVIIAPQNFKPGKVGNRLVIGWKEGTEASRALAAAKPFIKGAEQVLLVTVRSDDETLQSMEQVRGYIMLHGKDITIDILKMDGRNVGELLVTKAAEQPETLFVMGAYSHPRWQERAFGGVTEYVLRETQVPVLMAH